MNPSDLRINQLVRVLPTHPLPEWHGYVMIVQGILTGEANKHLYNDMPEFHVLLTDSDGVCFEGFSAEDLEAVL